jgi:hypothetical protein
MERISCVLELKEDDFHYNVYEELIEMYKERTDYTNKYVDFHDFKDEYLEYVKDDSNENFEKYNRNFCDYPIFILCSVKCKLYMLKKDFLEIEKDTCVFITDDYCGCIIMFYLKEDSKNIELAKDVWINKLNYGNFAGDSVYTNKIQTKGLWKWDSFDIKDKEKYITKYFTFNSYTEITVQTKFVMNEVKNF